MLRELRMGRRGHKECHSPTEGDSPVSRGRRLFYQTFPLPSLQACSGILASGQSSLRVYGVLAHPSLSLERALAWGWAGKLRCLRPSQAPWAPLAGSLGSFLIIRDV